MRRLIWLSFLFLVFMIGCSANEPTPTAGPTIDSLATVAVSGSGRNFTLLPEQSSVSYSVQEEFLGGAAGMIGKEAGTVTTVGTTNAISGQIVLDLSGESPSLVSGQASVDISTLTSDDSRRDDRIRSRWLESASFPTATFVFTSMEGFPAGAYQEGQAVSFQLLGNLTIRDVTRPVTFQVTATLQSNTLSGTATTQILMSDFGVEPPNLLNILTVADETTITLNFIAQEE